MMPDVLAAVRELVPWMQGRADALDREAVFPAEEMRRIALAGGLSLQLPVLGKSEADRLAGLLVLVGQGNLSVGRLLEAHINALHLIGRSGTVNIGKPDGLFGLWVTDPPKKKLRMQRIGSRILLNGGKQFCSGAGFVSGALVTAEDTDGSTRMLVLRLGMGERATPLPSPLQGMRAAVTGAVDFSGCETSSDAILGEPGDYLKEPDFSSGAWRGSAVALGGLIALIEQFVVQLRRSGRHESPHAQERLGHILIARETARLWVRTAARVAENPAGDAAYRVSTVGLARIGVETACLDAMRLVQRSLGLSAFRQGNPVERICRDLSTYLRQPAADEVLTESANWFADHPEANV